MLIVFHVCAYSLMCRAQTPHCVRTLFSFPCNINSCVQYERNLEVPGIFYGSINTCLLVFQVHPFDISDSSLMHLYGGVTHIKRAYQCSLLPTLSGIMSYILGIAINIRYTSHVWNNMTMKMGKEELMRHKQGKTNPGV